MTEDASTYEWQVDAAVLSLVHEGGIVIDRETAEALRALADAAIAWLDQGQMDRDERLLKAARAIKAMREDA